MKNAAKDKPPAPLVEKVGDPKPVDDSTAKVVGQERARTPPRPSAAAARRAAGAEAAEAKPEKKEPPKIDPIAET